MIKEWVGKTPLTRKPQSVKDRILCRYGWRCADCRLGFGPHVKVWFEGNENRESRLRPYCPACHREHAARDGRVRVGAALIKDRFELSAAYLTGQEEGKSNGKSKEADGSTSNRSRIGNDGGTSGDSACRRQDGVASQDG